MVRRLLIIVAVLPDYFQEYSVELFHQHLHLKQFMADYFIIIFYGFHSIETKRQHLYYFMISVHLIYFKGCCHLQASLLQYLIPPHFVAQLVAEQH